MAMRVATAFFGHFGVEADLGALSDEERRTLAAGIALHKAHRALIHGGDLVRLDRGPGEVTFGVMARDRSEALFSYTQVAEPRGYFADPLRLAGLDPAGLYRVTQIWPQPGPSPSPLIEALGQGLSVPGGLLMTVGLQPARMKPQEAMILHLAKV